ncbi:uncharacterized protein CLUP02_12378 [Colletotrichum lupini]|uniref:Uncharacterized protein n=1 Tax=Colletotrichum lupini TaxID=145971 RepID=A0A9Q8T275_9PEZI|nr:uncharacterized protein CLUP02_12378 [Colletotrichum lupini]UQC86876.1 hypothetical protein CLUP02_12378 [Colletotrichum lupini]
MSIIIRGTNPKSRKKREKPPSVNETLRCHADNGSASLLRSSIDAAKHQAAWYSYLSNTRGPPSAICTMADERPVIVEPAPGPTAACISTVWPCLRRCDFICLLDHFVYTRPTSIIAWRISIHSSHECRQKRYGGSLTASTSQPTSERTSHQPATLNYHLYGYPLNDRRVQGEQDSLNTKQGMCQFGLPGVTQERRQALNNKNTASPSQPACRLILQHRLIDTQVSDGVDQFLSDGLRASRGFFWRSDLSWPQLATATTAVIHGLCCRFNSFCFRTLSTFSESRLGVRFPGGNLSFSVMAIESSAELNCACGAICLFNVHAQLFVFGHTSIHQSINYR